MADQSDVNKMLLEQITTLKAEMLALKVYVASIPHDAPLQAIRNVMPHAAEDDLAARAHKFLDDMDVMRSGFRSKN